MATEFRKAITSVNHLTLKRILYHFSSLFLQENRVIIDEYYYLRLRSEWMQNAELLLILNCAFSMIGVSRLKGVSYELNLYPFIR